MRFLDLILSTTALIMLMPILIAIYFILLLETKSPLFKQMRIGKDEILFPIYKFRTMEIGTVDMPSHIVPSDAVTSLGKFLRQSKLDELPQLWCVLVGDMSLVGPRPNLPNQVDLINARRKSMIYTVRPGMTGLSQLSLIDMSTPKLLAETDAKMISRMSILIYFKYIVITILRCCGIRFVVSPKK